MNERLFVLLMGVLVVLVLALPPIIMGFCMRGRASGPRLSGHPQYY